MQLLIRLPVITLLLSCFPGCATSPDPTRTDLDTAGKLASQQKTSESLRPYYQRIHLEGESNATLNRMRLASAAITLAEWESAERALDEVLRDIEALGPADARSREALSKFEAEDIKRFKGEPYERSMAYLLRGLLYMKVKDWDNARACFKSVQVQDAAKNDPATRGNWASAHWLEGWCNWNLKEISAAHECWKRASQFCKIPRLSEQDNAIIVALLGFGPIKIPAGSYGERLTYREGESRTTQIRLKIKNTFLPLSPAEDILAQAKSRGLRQMDMVNQDKADTRAATETAGDVLIYGGAATTVGGAAADDTTAAAAGLGTMAVGMVSKGVASSMKPRADTRTWDLLPAGIQILPVSITAENRILEFQFLDSNGKVVGEQAIKVETTSNPQLILLTKR